MKLGDTYVYLDRVEDEQIVRLTALCVRIDDPGVGLNLPVVTCMVFSPSDDAAHSGSPFLTQGGLWALNSNNVGTFEPAAEE